MITDTNSWDMNNWKKRGKYLKGTKDMVYWFSFIDCQLVLPNGVRDADSDN